MEIDQRHSAAICNFHHKRPHTSTGFAASIMTLLSAFREAGDDLFEATAE